MLVKCIRTRAGLRFVARVGNVYAIAPNRCDAIRAACKAWRAAA